MQLSIAVSSLVLLLLLLGAEAKPTFDKLADALLNTLDEEPQYPRPRPRPYAPRGPLIQEDYTHGYDYGYDQGYDYYYGGGGGHGVVVGRPYAPPRPVYYPAPVQVPPKGYYASPPASVHRSHNYDPSGYSYGHTYGRTATETESVGGYKQHGY